MACAAFALSPEPSETTDWAEVPNLVRMFSRVCSVVFISADQSPSSFVICMVLSFFLQQIHLGFQFG